MQTISKLLCYIIAVLKRAAIIFRKRGLIYEEQKNYGNRLVRFFKIVNVNPVLRGWTLFGLFDQNTFDQAGLAGSLGAETEQVVPFGLDVDAEFHGAQGAILPQCRKPLFQLCGCCKLELVRVAFFV